MRTNPIFKKLSYSFGANLISFCGSILTFIFVPKLLPVEDYGMWQLFAFYFGYLGFLHFGWEDGIYLRYAGKKFEELDSKVFSGQFYGVIILQILLSLLAIFIANYFIEDSIRRLVFICAVSLTVLVNFNNLCNLIMQSTDKIKEYAIRIITERSLLVGGILFWLLLGYNSFFYMYLSQVISLVITAGLCAHFCWRLLKPPCEDLRSILQEAALNIQVGIKLMFASIAGMLILGVIRYGISLGWDIATFGKVSLTLGISNFLMIFISSVSVVLFPMLKHMDEKNLPALYMKIRNSLACVLFFLLIFYYPLEKIVSLWLPKYTDSLIYMAVLFPICLFESKMSLLINTYLKSLRREALMLKINVISVAISIIVTFFTVHILHDLNAAVFSIILIYAFRCELAEYHMERLLNIHLSRDIAVELIMAAIFIITGVGLNNWWATAIYGLAYVIYIFFNRQHVVELMQMIKR